MALHLRFNSPHWSKEMPLASLRDHKRQRLASMFASDPVRWSDPGERQNMLDDAEPWVQLVYGPREMTVIEQQRAGTLARRGPGVPTDVCIWGVGEPENPAATKIGGRPYRPANKPWPKDSNGEPMGLLAQFCFADSRDILPGVSLPGDILLIFTRGPHLYVDWDPEEEGSWVFEWHTLGSGTVQASVPRVLAMTPTYAELHRTMDYPESDIDDELNIIAGSKFGGIPPFQQGDPDLPGVHICTLGSLNPFGNPWPLLNVPVNPKGEQLLDPDLLMLGDLGAAYIYLDDRGVTRWAADCG